MLIAAHLDLTLCQHSSGTPQLKLLHSFEVQKFNIRRAQKKKARLNVVAVRSALSQNIKCYQSS